MGYDALLGALAEEVERQLVELREAAAREAAELRAAGVREAAALREALLATARAAAATTQARGREAARRIEERARLVEERRLLAALVAEVAAALPALADEALLARLLDEVLAEVGAGRVELVVDAGAADFCRRELARRGQAAEVRVRALAVGGVEAVVDALVVLDDTLPARFERVWAQLEARAAAALFAEDAGGAL